MAGNAPQQSAETAASSPLPADSLPAVIAAPKVAKRRMPLALSVAIGILLAGILAWFFYELTWLILLLYLSLVLATIVEAPVSYLCRKGIPRMLATVMILGTCLLLLGLLIYLVAISVNAQVAPLSADMKQVPARINRWVNDFKHRFPGIGEMFKDFDVAQAAGGMLPSVGAVWTRVSAGFEIVTYIVVTFFTVMYMVIEGPDQLKALRRVLPKSARLEATRLFQNATRMHRGWFLASVGNVASASVLTTFGLWLVGIPGAIVLGMIAGLGELIPTVGPAIFAIPAVIVTLIIRPELIVWVLVMFAVVQTFQGYTISPMMMKISVELPVTVTLVSVVAMGTLFGVLGVLVAIPLVTDLVVVWDYVNTMLEKDSGDKDQTNAAPEAPPNAPRISTASTLSEGGQSRQRSLFSRLRDKWGDPPASPR